MTSRWQTPPQLAEALAVSPETIINWIRSGELAAVNVGSGAKRPRYRIPPEAVEAWQRRRAVVPPPKPARRKRQATSYTKFFEE